MPRRWALRTDLDAPHVVTDAFSGTRVTHSVVKGTPQVGKGAHVTP